MTEINYTGQKYNHLTFIERTNERRSGRILWKLECDCVNKTAIYSPAYPVKIGDVVSCGCARRKDYTNQKYNRLTFVERSHKKGRIWVWKLLCDCGNITYQWAPDVIRGDTKSCGCLKEEIGITRPSKARKYEPKISTAKEVHQNVYSDCPFDVFLELSQQNCVYCGRPPHRTYNMAWKRKDMSEYQIKNGDFTYNGLDRVDNTRGHDPDNVVSCCFDCNQMKSNKTEEQFKEHVKRIYNHLFQNGQS